MKLAINGSFNWWSLVAFEKALGGPGIKHFDAKSYGSGVEMLYIELALQEDASARRDISTYRSEHAWAQFSIQLGPDIKAVEEAAAFRTIAEVMLQGLEKGLKRRKIPDFNGSAFLADLRTYIAEKTKSPNQVPKPTSGLAPGRGSS